MRIKGLDTNLAHLAEDLFNETEVKMLRGALSSSSNPADLVSLFNDWEAAKASFKTQTIAFNLVKDHPEIPLSNETRAILFQTGITSRKRYLEIFPHFAKVIKALDNKGIPFIIIKGGAMKAYRPDLPRWSADIDMLVPEDKYEEALSEASGLGYILHRSPHSAGLRESSSDQDFVDIHRYVSMDTGKERNLNKPLAERSFALPLSSTSVRVPCPEDMVFISLVNFWKNITHIFRENSSLSLANLFFDIKFLRDRKGDFDWEIIRSDARITGSVEAVYLAANVLGRIVPGVFPENFLENETDPGMVKRLMSRTLFTRNVLNPLRNEIGEFSVSKASKQKRNPFKYIYLRAKYFVLKRYPAGGFKTKG